MLNSENCHIEYKAIKVNVPKTISMKYKAVRMLKAEFRLTAKYDLIFIECMEAVLFLSKSKIRKADKANTISIARVKITIFCIVNPFKFQNTNIERKFSIKSFSIYVYQPIYVRNITIFLITAKINDYFFQFAFKNHLSNMLLSEYA
jgi:hypothetical protein